MIQQNQYSNYSLWKNVWNFPLIWVTLGSYHCTGVRAALTKENKIWKSTQRSLLTREKTAPQLMDRIRWQAIIRIFSLQGSAANQRKGKRTDNLSTFAVKNGIVTTLRVDYSCRQQICWWGVSGAAWLKFNWSTLIKGGRVMIEKLEYWDWFLNFLSQTTKQIN